MLRLRKRLEKKIGPGPLTPVWELCYHNGVLGPWNLTGPGSASQGPCL